MENTFKKIIMLMVGTAIVFTGCEKDELISESDIVVDQSVSKNLNEGVFVNYGIGRTTVTDPEVLEVVQNLSLDIGQITKGDFYLPDGTKEERIFIGDDIAMSLESLKLMNTAVGDQKLENNETTRHYRTTNIVSPENRQISIYGYTRAPIGLGVRAQNALRDAVDNFNAINGLSLNFTLKFGSSPVSAVYSDIAVYDLSISASPIERGGVSGFPVNGKPNKNIFIYNLQGLSRDVHEYVLTHEIGHSIGLRHTDWFNRSSCGGASFNEGQGAFGAVLIDGTPSLNDSSSLMKACEPNLNTSGEFNANDIIALTEMY